MTLGQLILYLKSQPRERVYSSGFGRPDSYRGYYDQVAFRPQTDVTIGEMLDHALNAIGPVFEGWKGGEYTYDTATPCHIADPGECVEPGSMEMMFTREEYRHELAALRASLAESEKAVTFLRNLGNMEKARAEKAESALAESERLRGEAEREVSEWKETAGRMSDRASKDWGRAKDAEAEAQRLAEEIVIAVGAKMASESRAATARAEALEEAAVLVESNPRIWYLREVPSAIRALIPTKETP
jgi:hypothetical protein